MGRTSMRKQPWERESSKACISVVAGEVTGLLGLLRISTPYLGQTSGSKTPARWVTARTPSKSAAEAAPRALRTCTPGREGRKTARCPPTSGRPLHRDPGPPPAKTLSHLACAGFHSNHTESLRGFASIYRRQELFPRGLCEAGPCRRERERQSQGDVRRAQVCYCDKNQGHNYF